MVQVGFVKKKEKPIVVPIENCHMYNSCPQVWNRLKTTGDINVGFCYECGQRVTFCTSKSKAKELILAGKKVCYYTKNI